MFQEQLGGTLEVIAQDVKLQVDFDPKQVKRYRLIGHCGREGRGPLRPGPSGYGSDSRTTVVFPAVTSTVTDFSLFGPTSRSRWRPS